MAEIDGGRIAARQLNALGIDHLFGVVAGPMIELFGGAQAEGMKVIGNRLELNGGFMASAWGWQKRKPGVFVAGSIFSSAYKTNFVPFWQHCNDHGLRAVRLDRWQFAALRDANSATQLVLELSDAEMLAVQRLAMRTPSAALMTLVAAPNMKRP